MSIRLAHIIDSLNRAGTQTALIHLVTGLPQRGYQQRVYCLNNRYHPNHIQQLTRAGVEVIIIGSAKIATGIGLIRLYDSLRHWQPHIVQTFLPVGDLVGRTVARLARVPAIVTAIRARNVHKHPWHLWIDRLTMPWADRVVFNARNAIEFSMTHEGVHPDQVVYIPNGVRLPAPAGGGGLPLGVTLSQEARVVGTVGRLKPQKGHVYLIRAFAQVRERVPQSVLLIIGDGFLRPDLEAEVSRLGVAENVRFLGERTDVPDLLACMDVYAHSAVFEGMPNAVMEAMAAGLPVVATGVDGTRELIVDGETGWLVHPADPDGLATRIVDALTGGEAARRVGETAARHMVANFSVEKMVGAFDELFRGLI